MPLSSTPSRHPESTDGNHRAQISRSNVFPSISALMRRFSFVLLTATAVLPTGCATIGNPFAPDGYTEDAEGIRGDEIRTQMPNGMPLSLTFDAKTQGISVAGKEYDPEYASLPNAASLSQNFAYQFSYKGFVVRAYITRYYDLQSKSDRTVRVSLQFTDSSGREITQEFAQARHSS